MKLRVWRSDTVTMVQMGPFYGLSRCHENDIFDLRIGILVAILKAYPIIESIHDEISYVRPPDYSANLSDWVVADLLDARLDMERVEATLKVMGMQDVIGDARLAKATRVSRDLDEALGWR